MKLSRSKCLKYAYVFPTIGSPATLLLIQLILKPFLATEKMSSFTYTTIIFWVATMSIILTGVGIYYAWRLKKIVGKTKPQKTAMFYGITIMIINIIKYFPIALLETVNMSHMTF